MQSLVAVISLSAVKRNFCAIAAETKKPLIAVVKDDAYGHGAEAVALALEGRANAFAVSTVDEGAALRTAGVTKDILVFTPPLDKEDALRMLAYDLISSVTSLSSLRLIARAGERTGKPPRAHLKVNTGMNRYGVLPQRAAFAAREAKRLNIALEGVYSHLYAAEDKSALQAQTELFQKAADRVREIFPDCIRHLSSTGGILSGDGFDAVRAGIALYGYLPAGFEGRLSLEPAMKLYATVAHACRQSGGGIGYGAADRDYGSLHTLRLGYGDGFFRAGIEGSPNKLCMDACVQVGKGRFGRK